MFVHEDVFTPAHWFPARTLKTLQPGEMAYENNLGTLVREALHDSAQVVLMEWAANPHDTTVGPYMAYYDTSTVAMRRVAAREGVNFVPFPHALIRQSHWVDDCHLNEEGERIKAAYLAPFLLHSLE